MASMTTGDNNTAVGVQALNTEDVGRGTTAIGYQALFSQNSDSNDNSFESQTSDSEDLDEDIPF